MRMIVSATLLVAALASAQAAGAAELRTLRYGLGQDGGGTGGAQEKAGLGALPYIVSQRKGFFEQAGIRLQIVRPTPHPGLNSQDVLFEALSRGEFDMTRSQLPFHIRQVLKGADFAAVAGNTANSLLVLMARPEIKSFADLRSKTVAVTLPYDLITLTMLRLMEQHGIKKDDVRVAAITGSGPRAACLRSGECAAVAVNQPQDSALVAEGFHVLGTSHELPPLLFIAEIVDKTWAEANQETVVAYIRGLAATMRYINDPKNGDEMRSIIREATQSSDSRRG